MKTMVAMALNIMLALGVTVGVPAAENAQQPQDPVTAYCGTWILDKSASDDITRRLPGQSSRPDRGASESASGSEPRGGRGRGGGRMGGGGKGAGSRGAGSRGAAPGMDRAPDGDSAQRKLRLQKRASRLEIFTDGGELDITDGLDMTRLLYCDGRTVTIWTESGEVKANARWQSGRITETWSGGRGSGRTIIYELSEDGSTLMVTERRPRPGDQPDATLHLVYRRQVSGR